MTPGNGPDLSMNYFMTEIEATDWLAAVAWYRDVLGLRVVLEDTPNRFALLEAGQGGKVAIKEANLLGGRSAIRLVFEVADLNSTIDHLNRVAIPFEGPRTSSEGYREIRFRDPDGTRIGIFEWVRPLSELVR